MSDPSLGIIPSTRAYLPQIGLLKAFTTDNTPVGSTSATEGELGEIEFALLVSIDHHFRVRLEIGFLLQPTLRFRDPLIRRYHPRAFRASVAASVLAFATREHAGVIEAVRSLYSLSTLPVAGPLQ